MAVVIGWTVVHNGRTIVVGRIVAGSGRVAARQLSNSGRVTPIRQPINNNEDIDEDRDKDTEQSSSGKSREDSRTDHVVEFKGQGKT